MAQVGASAPGTEILPGDPAALWLRNLRPSQAAAVAVLTSVVFNIVAVGILSVRGEIHLLLPRIELMIYAATYDFFVVPLILAWHAWVSRAPLSLLDALLSRGLFTRPTGPDVVRERLWGASGAIRTVFGYPGWFWGGVIIALLLGLLGILHPLRDNQAIKFYSEMQVVIIVPFCYISWMILSRIISTIIVLGQLFRQSNLELNPLHPDRFGGLGPLNQYAQTLVRFIGAIGLGLVVIAVARIQTQNIMQQYLLLIAIVVYLVFAPLCFFGTLGTAHPAMSKARGELLNQISEKFPAQYHQTLKELERSGEISETHLANLERLRKLHAITEAFPVWPFDAASIRQFATAFVTPLLPLLATVVANLAKQIWKSHVSTP